MEDEELIRRRMEETRAALSDKVETLERKLSGSVQEGVEAVRNAMNIQAHFERHPWLMLGGSLLGGYLVATMLTRESGKQVAGPTPPALPPSESSEPNGKPAREPEETPEAKKDWLSAFEPEIDHLKRLALGVALGTVREVLTAEAPPEMAEHLRAILDDVTKKAGGEVLSSSEWQVEPSPFSPPDDGHNGASGGFDPDQPRW